MPGLDPGIQEWAPLVQAVGLDRRVKPGDDNGG